MPVINIAGNLDGFRFPIYDIQPGVGPVPSTVQQIVDGINSWARVNHAKEISLDDVMALKGRTDISEEEKNLGLSQDSCRRWYYKLHW